MTIHTPTLGIPVTVTPALPVPPSPGEEARRIVRHGMADVLAWLGHDVGPAPADQIHVIRTPDRLLVSQQLYDHLRDRAKAPS